MSEDRSETQTPISQPADEPGLGLAGGGVSKTDDGSYRVLARKYRPSNFDELIGQEAMVRTLRNAFESNRIAHGFILTGVRGIGKTTTARIIAKGLNCMGENGTDRNDGAPTVNPCGVCPNCQAIAESRHVDVQEMDAASRTGIDDIREIIEGVRYAPVSARFKVYIIDEVHMLSKAAFNGLLKTLEEPPPHVKFIFATTEIRKVPITVLSRCQRFDLRRIQSDEMIAHLQSVAAAEGFTVEQGALRMITRAAEGSARDALSLLDQAISHGTGDKVEEAAVRDMLGLVDRGRIFDLYETLMSGDIASALDQLRDLHIGGGDPITILQDLLEVTPLDHALKGFKGSGRQRHRNGARNHARAETRHGTAHERAHQNMVDAAQGIERSAIRAATSFCGRNGIGAFGVCIRSSVSGGIGPIFVKRCGWGRQAAHRWKCFGAIRPFKRPRASADCTKRC